MAASETDFKNGSFLRVEDLRVFFPVGGKFLSSFVSRAEPSYVRAVDRVTFDLVQGETLSLVGETGSGKTTTARASIRLIEPTSGRILFKGYDVLKLSKKEIRSLRRQMQIVFQDPYGSLNPRRTVEDIVGMPLSVHRVLSGPERRDRIVEILEMVGLHPGALHMTRYPHEFSGGQRQRIGIARALVLNPELLVLDEPVSSLDVSIRSQILNLLQDLKRELNLTYLLIAHDLSVVRYMSDRIAIMYLGRIVELSESESLFANPQHPYTEALLAAVPVPDPALERRRIRLKGETPSPIHPPSGCHFHPRCPFSQKICAEQEPRLRNVESHLVACHFPAGEREPKAGTQ